MERGLLPQPLVALGIRRNLRSCLDAFSRSDELHEAKRFEILCQSLRSNVVALVPEKANQQHYEIPPAYFELVLGKRLKYSSALWTPEVKTLDQAEEAMLALYAERAQLTDGMNVLELGCGWGSFSLWAAERYPHLTITGVSNSRSQREYILAQAQRRGLNNIRIITADINAFEIGEKFDRIVSVEMFEHLRNYEVLFARIAEWLTADGKLFAHIFCHRRYAYEYESEGAENWMGRYFFTGGIMPSEELFFHFQRDLLIQDHWRVDGRHYEKTARAWLARHLAAKDAITDIFKACYGAEALRWYHRWSTFYLACAELFGFHGGSEWFVAHYLFQPNRERARMH